MGLCGGEHAQAGLEELALHPTVKPVALVADAIRDCSKRGGIVLDPFAGSGTTLIAAEKTGRCARAIEFDPAYCDVIVHRFEQITGNGGRGGNDQIAGDTVSVAPPQTPPSTA